MKFRDYVPTRVLHDFVGRIEPLGIKYMLTGSMAMMRYASFRQTADIDIVLEFDPEVKDKFIKVLEPDYYVPHNAVVRAFETKRMFNVIHIETAFKIDCVPKKSDDFQQSAFERRERTDYYGKDIWIISKEDLILSKLWWAKDTNSEMQFRDIKSIMFSGFDKNYAEKWLDKLGVRESYFKCLNEVES
ncbi:MAG TPA: DUF6036 family nucleotidyltransferase [Pyrinomonadaceae bacterium]|nr:DUF6036 family nucleotidyltransferase [Pyrinomonadaceae bacterium]